MKKKAHIQIRRKTAAATGRTPRNLPDVHPDENCIRCPPLPDMLSSYPKADEIWRDICRTLIKRGKLKFNHLPIVAQAVMFYSLAHCSVEQLIELHYVEYDKAGNMKPPLVTVRKTCADEFLKCYSALKLDPKHEMYDCMIENSGRSTIEMDTYDEL